MLRQRPVDGFHELVTMQTMTIKARRSVLASRRSDDSFMCHPGEPGHNCFQTATAARRTSLIALLLDLPPTLLGETPVREG